MSKIERITPSSSNSQEARVERYVRLAQNLGLTVHGFELLEGRGIRVLTQPLAGAAPEAAAEDPVDRWLRENG